jgi:hypothetical protein
MPQVLGYAVIGPNGLQASSGVIHVEHADVGNWHIYFDFNAGTMIQIASIAQFETAGWIAAYGEPGTLGANEVTVDTGKIVGPDPGSIRTDLVFQLAIIG